MLPATAPRPPTPLLEREHALALLNTSLEQCRAGAGRTVLVSGEAGLGKTTLLNEWARQAKQAHGAQVFAGGCEALFTPRPLGPVLDIAHALGSAMAALVQRETSPAALFAAFGGWLAVPSLSLAGKQPMSRVNVLIFEDVHWADHLTLDFLKYLGRRIHQWPAMLVLSYRDDEVGTAHPLTQVLGDLPSANVDRLSLSPLSLDAVCALSGYASDGANKVLAVTGGNPFFLTEVLAAGRSSGAAGLADLPNTVAMAVMARVQRVSDAARQVLAVTSLVPGSIDPAFVLALVGEPATDGAEEAVQAGLLQWDRHQLAFRHELARRAVEASLSPVRRRGLHARLYLLMRQQSQVLIDRTAYHAQHADDSQAVLATAPVAAARAAAMGAHREAAAHYRAALDHAQNCDAAQRADLLERWAEEVYFTSPGLDEAIAARLQALELRRALGQLEQVGLNQRGLSTLCRARGESDQAKHWLDAAITTLESIEPSASLAKVYGMRAAVYMVTNQWQLAQEWGERAIHMAKRFADHGTVAHALNSIGSALADDGQLRGFELLRQSLDLALAHGLHDHIARAYRNASVASVRIRQLAQAETFIVPGIEFAYAHDMDVHLSHLRGALVDLRFLQGRLAEAQSLAQEALIAEAPGAGDLAPYHPVLSALALVDLLRRPDADATALHAQWQPTLALKEPDRIVPMALGLAEAAWLRGDNAACVGFVREALQACAELTLWDWGELAIWVHRAGQDPRTLHAAALVEPCLLEIQGDAMGAARAWGQLGMPRHEAYALMRVDPALNADALAQAITSFDRMGAVACADYARRHARKWAKDGIKGIKTGLRGAARTNHFGLTPRELQVAQQLAAGRSNQEIAQALSRSPRTVEHHVATALAKLGAKRRSDVAALLAEAEAGAETGAVSATDNPNKQK